MKSLKEFCLTYKTDKHELGYIDNFYAPLLDHKKKDIKSILEIGVQNGYSAFLWRDFFQNATVTCVDINECSNVIDQERINFYQTDAYTEEFVSRFEDNSFDLIIDDGPHTFKSMEFFLKNYLNLVKSNGILILEDIVDVNWTADLVSMIDPKIGEITIHKMSGKALTEDLNEKWKSGLDVIIVEKS